jgi:hypothetical protein
MNGAVPLLPLCAFMARTRTTLPCHHTSDTLDSNRILKFLVKCWNFTKNEITENLMLFVSYPITSPALKIVTNGLSKGKKISIRLYSIKRITFININKNIM